MAPFTVLPLHYGVPEPVFGSDSGAAFIEHVSSDMRRVAGPWRMSHQPEFTSQDLPASPAPPGVMLRSDENLPLAQEPSTGQPQQRIPHWLVRTELYLRVLLRMYIGLAICYAPWSQLFWDQNPLFVRFPTLAIYAANGAVRGIISGLGLLNIWIALQDAIRHRSE